MPVNKIITIAIGVVVGGVLGFLLYKLVGCNTGQCPITSNPWISTAYGALLGLMLSLGVNK
jgi:hypothetical protein